MNTPRLPAVAQLLAGFPTLLREFEFTAAPDQTTTFLRAVKLLGPRSIEDVRRAAYASFAPDPARHDEFDALFRAWFHGESVPVAMARDDNERVEIRDDGGAQFEPEEMPQLGESGQLAAPAESLAARQFTVDDESWTLRRFARAAPAKLARRTGFRRERARRGSTLDLRRALGSAVRTDGDVVKLPWRRRSMRQRQVLLLIDVSGSMKDQTESTLRFAHALMHACDRMECFTFGTRLTRITRALSLRNPEQALARAAALVADWDGGTRIGDALKAFLSVPRFTGYARGAVTMVVSDGLERGSHDAMVDAVARFSRLSWRLSWLSPLAADTHYEPTTAALKAVLPLLDDFHNGANVTALCDHVLGQATRLPETMH